MLQKNTGLIIAIIFAALVVSGSTGFIAYQLNAQSGELSASSIEAGIENYIQKQQESQKEVAQKEADVKKSLAQNVQKVSASEDHIRGNKDAKISLIEFSDFECPYCKRFHSTAQAVVDAYEGDVNWVYRHFPLQFHDPLATKAAVATECANDQDDNEKFWEMADLIYETTNSGGRGMDPSEFSTLAERIGLEKSEFEACMDSGRFDEHIKSDIADGSSAGVAGTPGTIILNNQTGEAVLIEGAQPLESFQKVIDAMINK